MVIPAAALADDLTGNQKAGAGNRTARAEHHAGIVEEFCLTQEPQRIASGNPVGAEVFGIAVAGDNAVAL